jgi:N-acetyl-gamma-glutamyl-phosphate reductase
MAKVFIDGSAGTTGLKILQRLSSRSDIELNVIDDEHRKDADVRREYLNRCDVAILCLPDDAAREAVSMIENPDTAVIDTSTAHRTSEGWTYGFPELTGQMKKIASSKRIANPGCHAIGFISLIAPLVQNGIIESDALLSAFSITGYSGGGKKMIADYAERGDILKAPRMYGLTQKHKHLPEMKAVCGLLNEPVFSPVVSSYYAGMEVVVPVFRQNINCGIDELKEFYRSYYTGKVVRYSDDSEDGFMSSGSMETRDDMKISVCGNEERILLVSRFDNLGKGASGSAIQNLNILLGVEETTDLNLKED